MGQYRNHLLAALFMLLANTAQAQDTQSGGQPPAIALSPEQRADLARIEDYLNRITTLQARFAQVSSAGQFAEGTFYLSRPGGLRIDYDPPVPILMVTSGNFLVYYDEELDQSTHIPLSATPAGVLVDDSIALNGEDIRVTGMAKNANSIRVSVVQADDPGAGTMTLLFSDAPLALRQWAVLDAQGVNTEFALMNPRFGIEIDPELFVFRTEFEPGGRK